MKLSLFQLLDRGPNGSPDVVSEALHLGRHAEALDFDGVWVAEHHFRDFGGMPNPAVYLAALAARTERLRLGSAVSVLPFRSPVSIAEDYALVDRISDGRLQLGVGSGTLAFEFDGFGIDRAEKRARFDESLDALERLLALETVSCHGQFVTLDGVSLNVAPIQQPPPIYVATNSLEGAYGAGRRGQGLLTLVAPSPEKRIDPTPRLLEHARGLRDAGLPPGHASAVVFVFASVGESDRDALDQASAPFAYFAESHQMAAPGRGSEAFEAAANNGNFLAGSAERVGERLGQLEAAGAAEVALWMSFGGMPTDRVEASMKRIAELRSKPGTRLRFTEERAR